MLIRTLAAAAALLAATPALAQTAPARAPAQAPAAAPASAEDAAYLERLRGAVASFVKPTNAERAEVLLAMLRATSFEPEVETFQGGNPQTGPMEGRNISVFLPSVRDESMGEILLVAHYDAVKLRDGSMSHGVVDNAASVVALVEAIRLIGAKHLGHDVRVIFTDQEELGLIGARKWIEAHGLTNVVAVVNSDVAAYGDTMMYGQNNGPQSAGVTRAVQALCAERAMQCVGYPIYPPSEDRAFSAAGAPTVSLGFQDQIGAHQMWLAFNGGENNGLAPGFVPQVFKLIHSSDDTMEHVDPATVRTASEVYAALVERLSGQLGEPSQP